MLLMPLALLLTSNMAQVPAPTPAQANLVAAEYGFTDKVVKEGIRAGFMANLRADAPVFIPREVNGLTYYRTQLELGAILKWAPIVAEVSQSGDLGYTTGPWTYSADKDAPASAFGWFVDLWQRDGNGPWKVRLDIGIPTPDPAEREAPKLLPRQPGASLAPVTPGQGNSEELLKLDRDFSAAAGKDAIKSALDAYKARIDEKVRFYRKNRFPVEGAARLTTALDADLVSWTPKEAIVSASNDLACTRGTFEHKSADGKSTLSTGNYVHIWKKVGSSWKLALDLELPVPAKQ